MLVIAGSHDVWTVGNRHSAFPQCRESSDYMAGSHRSMVCLCSFTNAGPSKLLHLRLRVGQTRGFLLTYRVSFQGKHQNQAGYEGAHVSRLDDGESSQQLFPLCLCLHGSQTYRQSCISPLVRKSALALGKQLKDTVLQKIPAAKIFQTSSDLIQNMLKRYSSM